MSVTPQSFRFDFPEFNSSVNYTNSAIIYWLNLGTLLINQELLGGSPATPSNPPATLYDIALELFAAHNLVLEAVALATSKNNGIPGLTSGLIAAKSAGGVSQNYDTASGVDPADGQYNLTIYGTRFINLYKLAGAPGFVANGNGSNANYGPYPVFGVGQAWSGPPIWGYGPWSAM